MINGAKKIIGIGLVGLLILIQSCDEDKKTPVIPEPEVKAGITFESTGAATFAMHHYFKDSVLEFSPKTFITKANDTIKVTEFRYYVSRIKFYKSDGTYWDANNYELMDAAVASNISISNIPAGNYTKVEFNIGVDTPYNHSLDHPFINALDPAHGMSWGWSTGYIFTRIKGYHGNQNGFSFDLGGDNHLIKLSFDLTGKKLKAGSVQFDFKVDVNEMFETPNTYSLKTQSNAIHNAIDPEIELFIANMKNGMFTLRSIQ